MKISEYIMRLSNIKKDHGDLEVDTYGYPFKRVVAEAPQVAYRMILRPRESKSTFWVDFYGEDRKGEIDGIGDTIVTLCILAKMYDTTANQCLESAYNEIKDRKGEMVDEVFVREKGENDGTM